MAYSTAHFLKPLPSLSSAGLLQTVTAQLVSVSDWSAFISFKFPSRSTWIVCCPGGRMESEEFELGKKKKKALVTKCYLKTFSCSRKRTAIRHPWHVWKQDGQIAQYKCVDLDRDRSAHRVYLNSGTARDRLIVSNSFWFYILPESLLLCVI